jgi:dTDP-4-dehydrorhamnose reductase
VTDPSSVAQIAAGSFGPLDWAVNCAAYTAVDNAETHVREATELNAFAPSYLARACVGNGCRLLHVSTDFVFDGTANEPYAEDAATGPLNVYGRTKLEGERGATEAHPNAIVVRTSWLYGPNGASFPRTIIRAYEAGKRLRVVADQHGCPTYTADLAQTMLEMMERNAFPGIYHAVGPDVTDWHEFACCVLYSWTGEPVPVEAIGTEDWPTPAVRPRYSVLGTSKLAALGIDPMRPLNEALADFCARLEASLGQA